MRVISETTPLSLLGPFLLLAAGSLASAQPGARSDCRDDQLVDRCAEDQQSRVRALFGVGSIEEHRSAGDQVRRVFYVDGYGRDLVAISFVRARGRDPVVWVHYPRQEGQPRPEPLQAPVPQAVWDDIFRRSRNFDRSFAPRPDDDPSVIRMCIHPWVYTIEGTDPAIGNQPGTSRRKTESACEGGPGAFYAHEVERAALSLLPHCAALDRSQHRREASMLDACRMLRGDRLAAAEVLNLAGAFGRASTPEEAGLIYGRFGYRAIVDWNGSSNEGPGSALGFWIRKRVEEGRASFFVQSVDGESADRVRLLAMLSRSIEVPEGQERRYESARVEQIWVRGQGVDFTIESATVGPWEPARPN